MTKSINFTLSGEDKEIDDGIIGFAKATGWTPTVIIDGEEVDNPVTVEEHGSNKMFEYLKDTLIAYNADWGAEWGRKQAMEETEARLSEVQHTLNVQ